MRSEIVFCAIDDLASRVDPARTVLVTEPGVLDLYGARFPSLPRAVVPQGEAAKAPEALLRLYEEFASIGVDRSWTVLGIGGGSVSDLAGFAAHTWMRGIPCSFAPTTLLAMIDASLGGKNGIDLLGYKNVVGSVQIPERIFCDIGILRTLNPREFASGMAESIKHSILDGESHFGLLESVAASSHRRPVSAHEISDEALRSIIQRSQEVKLRYVEEDPFDRGRRKLLNFGHTIGHAVESVTGMRHGEAVAIGICLECGFSAAQGDIPQAHQERIMRLLSAFGLPVRIPEGLTESDKGRILSALTLDKKRSGGSIDLAYPYAIGDAAIKSADVGVIRRFLEEELR